MTLAGLLYAKEYKINDRISLRIPLVGEVLDNEDAFFQIVSTFISTPYDMMVQLDDIGIDFTKISRFELFCLLFGGLQEMDTSLLFGDLSFKDYKAAMNEQSKEMILIHSGDNTVIDKATHAAIANAIKKILFIEKKDKKPGNEEARKYMLERARAKQKRAKRRAKEHTSQIENMIVGLVNTSEFPYDYESVRGITIYQLYASLQQISHKIKYDKTMIGYFAGTVKLEDLSQDDRSWLKL